MKCWFLSDIVVRDSKRIKKFFPDEDKMLPAERDPTRYISGTNNVIGRWLCPPFLVPDLNLNVLNHVWWFDIEGNNFPLDCVYKYLHFIIGTKVQQESGVRLYVVVRKSMFIFQLRPSEEKVVPG